MSHAARRPSVVITGCTSGVGRACVRRFAKGGFDVALVARDDAGLQAAAREVEELGGRSLILPADVADADAVQNLCDRVVDELGGIDVWVNNAMTTVFAPVHEISPEEIRRVTEVNYLGTVYATMAALKVMRQQGAGTIVQVGSALAYRAIPLQSAYCGSKHAIRGFTDSLRTELMHEDSPIHVTMVQLPGLNTPQFDHCRSKMPRHPMPVPPIYQPEVAAESVFFAAHAKRREVFVGASAAATIWANKLIPQLLDRYLARTAIDGQQTDEQMPGPRPGNLFEPISGDPGAHGDFDRKAHSRSVQLQLTRHRALVGAAGAAAGLLALVGRVRSRP